MKRNRGRPELPVLERLVRPKVPDLSPAAARALLQLQFDPLDQERMHEHSLKNNAGTLNESDREELDRYLRLGHFLDLVHAKASRTLRLRSM